MLQVVLDGILPASKTIQSQLRVQVNPKYTPSNHRSTLPGNIPKTLPSLLGGTPPPCLTVHFQVYLPVSLRYSAIYALKYSPKCIWWHSSSPLGPMLRSTLSRGMILPMSHNYTPMYDHVYSVERLGKLQMLVTVSHEGDGIRQPVFCHL